MKPLKQFFVLILVAFVAFALFACKEDDPPPPEEPVATTYDLYLKEIKITINYKKKVAEEKPTHLKKIDAAVTAFNDNIDTGGTSSIEVFNDLKTRGGDYIINVIYGVTSFDGFIATDGRSLKVHDSWLSADDSTITALAFRNAFKAMLALPAIDENGVPYYGTLPYTTIKIYKGDATITDEQMKWYG